MTFIMGMKSFFGLKDGQKLSEFALELKELTYEDRLEIHAGLAQNGVVCDPPAQSA